MAVKQGDIYWVRLAAAADEAPRIPHPYVVIQENALDGSPLPTFAACALTTNLKRVSLPGNVLLDAGEANLPRQSVVEVAKIIRVDQAQLGDLIGTLSPQRVAQILAGIRFIKTAFLPGE